ncbi:MAG: LytR/AlgR family response regulator transcription factor [Chitinophagaceae bacterium]
MSMINQSAQSACLFLRVNYSLVKIDPADILYIECADNYMKLHLKEGRPLLVRITLKALMKMLPEGFMRIHRSYVVALGHISAVRNKSLKVGTSELPLGVSYEEPFMRKIKNSPTFGHAHY